MKHTNDIKGKESKMRNWMREYVNTEDAWHCSYCGELYYSDEMFPSHCGDEDCRCQYEVEMEEEEV